MDRISDNYDESFVRKGIESPLVSVGVYYDLEYNTPLLGLPGLTFRVNIIQCSTDGQRRVVHVTSHRFWGPGNGDIAVRTLKGAIERGYFDSK